MRRLPPAAGRVVASQTEPVDRVDGQPRAQHRSAGYPAVARPAAPGYRAPGSLRPDLAADPMGPLTVDAVAARTGVLWTGGGVADPENGSPGNAATAYRAYR